MLADSCGNLRIGFDWEGIYNGGKRWVEGASGLSPSRRITPDVAIVLPGREFVGSTNPDPNKPGDPRKPLIKLLSGTDELALEGTVDQPASIVHILPRLRVDRVCDASPDCTHPEAGLAVVEDGLGDGKEVDAHPIDRPGSQCQCKEIREARYFTCEGGDYEGRPCTRPAHCGSGFCTGTPKCQPAGAVWRTDASPGSSTECNDDQRCLDTDPAFPQCGYLLFDATEKKDDSGKITLNSKFGEPKSERGVCEPGRKDACKRDKSCTSNHCSGYVLRARSLFAP